MRRWHVSMTFEGYQEGDTSYEAQQKFKTALGLAPAALRSEIHMTGCSTRTVDPDLNDLPPDRENVIS